MADAGLTVAARTTAVKMAATPAIIRAAWALIRLPVHGAGRPCTHGPGRTGTMLPRGQNGHKATFMIAPACARPGHTVWDRLLARWTHNPPVLGSSPSRPTLQDYR